MSVPIMLPLLKATSVGKQWQLTAIREELARLFHLSPDERRELLPGGTQRVFDNRVAWAKTYLVKAKLLEAPQRAHIKITGRGLKILAGQPGSISVSFLKQFPEFNEFIAPNDFKNGQTAPAVILASDGLQTPIEKLDDAVRDLNQKLAVELLDYIREMDPYEKRLTELMIKYNVGVSAKKTYVVKEVDSDYFES